MSYIFISDYAGQIIGGAEFVDETLKEFLPSSISMRCIDCTPEKLSKLKDNRFIISNFIALAQDCKDYITKNCNYIIWEHDHKYLKTRNPSVFKDWVAPKDQLQNIEFYKAAKSIVCQTQQHLDVVYKNTGLTNLVNYGGSIWSNEQLDYLEEIVNKAPTGPVTAILDSEIIHKGTRQAIEYAKQSNKPYKLLGVQDWKDFIKELSASMELLFLPQVLETCSRIAVEARMIGLKVIGNNNLSALKEDWFKKYKGLDLINYFREKNKNIQRFVETCFRPIQIQKYVPEDVTVILNLYKRPQNLQKQIDALLAQTIKPKEIWVWQNNASGPEIGMHNDFFTGANYLPLWHTMPVGIDKWITSNNNWKFFGRFSMAQMVNTHFVALLDDDTIPGPEWLENCINTDKTNTGILGGIGVVLHSDSNYHDHHRFGWATKNAQVEEVDLVGHAWFFRKEYLKYMWMEEPFTWNNAEDIHFAAMAQKYGKLKSIVPVQNNERNTSSLLGYELGVDEVATSNPKNHTIFYNERDAAVKYYTENGWKRVSK